MIISDELSIDSTITYSSENQNDSPFLFDTEEITYTSNVEELEPQINNIVSSVNLGSNINLKNIALKIKNAEYNSNKFSKIILKSKDKNITATIFPNGKMICSGSKTEKESKLACKKFAKIVNKVDGKEDKIDLKSFKIQNIVASYDVKFKICLSKLYNEISNLINNSKNLGNNNNYVKFNNDIVQSLIFYLNEPKISLSIFESGKVVLSGAKKRKEFEEIFRNIYPLIIESKKISNEKKE